MSEIKVALLDRRFGTHGGYDRTHFTVRRGIKLYSDQCGMGNTFSFIDAFGEVMTGPLEMGTDYSILKDYDLVYLRIRNARCAEATKQLRHQCPKPVIVGYSDELANDSLNSITATHWIHTASLNTDVTCSSFPEKYDRPKHERAGVINWRCFPFAGDIHYWKKFYREKKESIVAGMFHMRSFLRGGVGDRIHSQTLQLMKRLQDKHGVQCRFFLNFDGHKQLDLIEPYVKKLGLDVELVKHVSNVDFQNMLAECSVFVEEYQCPNNSRATMVSAAVGTPQVGTDMNTASNICFPDTTIIHGEWNDFYVKAEKLLINPTFHRMVQEKALNNSNYYYYDSFRERMMKLYNELKGRRK